MASYAGLIILLVTCWGIQIGLSYYQHRDYNKMMNQIKGRTDGYLGVGVAKAKFKLGRGVISLLVTDVHGTILDYREMSGYTVFARFKQKDSLIGQNVQDIANSLKGKQRIRAFQQAQSLIDQELLKMEGI